MAVESSSTIKNVSWSDFLVEIFSNRIWRFICQPISVFYLIFIVGVLGSTGVWLPLVLTNSDDTCFNYDETLSMGLATYCIAILSATIADQFLLKEGRNKTVDFFTFGLFCITVLMAYITLSKKNPNLGYWATGFSYLAWIIIYSKDPAKQDQASDSPNPTGDDPKLSPLKGSVESFKTE